MTIQLRLFIISLALSLSAMSQQAGDYALQAWTRTAAGLETETYVKSGDTVEHLYYRCRSAGKSGRAMKRCKTKRMKQDGNLSHQIEFLDSLQQCKTFQISVRSDLKDSLLAMVGGKLGHDVDIQHVMDLFVADTTLILNIDSLIPPRMQSTCICAMFFGVQLVYWDSDMVRREYKYTAKLPDSPRCSDYQMWLAWYVFLQNHEMFPHSPYLHSYFGEDNLEAVLMTFIGSAVE